MPKSWGEKGGKEAENALGGLRYDRFGKSGRRMENNSNR